MCISIILQAQVERMNSIQVCIGVLCVCVCVCVHTHAYIRACITCLGDNYKYINADIDGHCILAISLELISYQPQVLTLEISYR